MEARDLVVQALVPAIRCEGLDDCVHDLNAGFSAGVSQACPDRASLLYPLPPVLHVRALMGDKYNVTAASSYSGF